MKRDVQQPVTTPCEFPRERDTRTTHPAFAGIVAHRVTGYRALYGSDFRHRSFMRVTITRSEHIRGLSHDSYHGSMRPLIEVDMTEAQWAEFISAPNIGSGVPCTIDSFNGERMPYLPDPEDKREVFTDEAREHLVDGMRQLAEIKAMLATQSGISKTAQRAIAAKIETAERQLGPNLDFVAKSFAKHVENTVSKAKPEIHGHMLRQMTRAGSDAMGMPLALDVDESRPAVEADPPAKTLPKPLDGSPNEKVTLKTSPTKPGKIKIVKQAKPG